MTADQLRAKGYVELPSGAWAKGGIGDELEIVPPENLTKPPKRIGLYIPTQLTPPKPPKRLRQSSKPLMNETEARYYAVMVARGYAGILAQAITLRLDPPFKSYRPDFFAIGLNDGYVFVEVKGPHRFREKGIAKAALAAKTYPQFRFELAEWTGTEWKESVLTP